jgi:hypothetical protein
VEDGRCVGLTTFPPSYADCHEIWNPQGLSRHIGVALPLLTMCRLKKRAEVERDVCPGARREGM